MTRSEFSLLPEPRNPSRATLAAGLHRAVTWLSLLTVLLVLSTAAKAQIPAGGSGQVSATNVTQYPAVFQPAVAFDSSYKGSWTIRDASYNVVSSKTFSPAPYQYPDEGYAGQLDPTAGWSARAVYCAGSGGTGTAKVSVTTPTTASAGTYTVTFSEQYQYGYSSNPPQTGFASRSCQATFTIGSPANGVPATTTLTLTGRNLNSLNAYAITNVQWGTVPGTVVYRLRYSTTPGGPYTDSSEYTLDTAGSSTQSALIYRALTKFDYPDNSRTYFFVVTAVNAYGASAKSNEVRVSPTSLVYIGQGQSNTVPSSVVTYGVPDYYQTRTWKIFDAAGNTIATGVNGQSSNGWQATITKSTTYVPPSVSYYQCSGASQTQPGQYVTGYAITVTVPAGVLPRANYSVESYGGSAPGPPQQNPQPGMTEARGYFDVTGTAGLFRVSQGPRSFVTSDPAVVAYHVSIGWQNQGVIGYVLRDEFTVPNATVPVYRMVNGPGDTLMLNSTINVQNAMTVGYTYQELAFYLYPGTATGRRPLYRFVNTSTGFRYCNTDPAEAASPPPSTVLEELLGYTIQ